MNYYDILGVSVNASTEDIKQSFKVLAKKYHPDFSKEQKAQEEFISIHEAYSTLVDAGRRAAYDKTIPIRKDESHYTNIINTDDPDDSREWTYAAKDGSEYYPENPYEDAAEKSAKMKKQVNKMVFIIVVVLLLLRFLIR